MFFDFYFFLRFQSPHSLWSLVFRKNNNRCLCLWPREVAPSELNSTHYIKWQRSHGFFLLLFSVGKKRSTKTTKSENEKKGEFSTQILAQNVLLQLDFRWIWKNCWFKVRTSFKYIQSSNLVVGQVTRLLGNLGTFTSLLAVIEKFK